MAAQTASPRARAESSASPRSPKASDDWVISAKISSLSYGELKAIAYRHPGLIYNPHLTEKVRLFLAMELGLQRMALDTIATLRVSPYETSEEGVTILHLACAKGFAKILSLFQERKADLEAANERGETPLFVAAQAGHADIVEQLVKAGCRATTTNAHGVSALQVAALSGHLSVVQLLLKLGVSDKGQTSAAMAHMLDRRGSSHRLIAHLLSMPAKPDFASLGEPRMKASESPKGTDSGNPRTMVLPRSASAEGPGRPRRGSDGDRDKHEKKHSGKKRLSKGASDGLALSKLVDRDEKKEERDRDERKEKKDKDERKEKDDKKEKKERDGKGSN